MPHGIDYAANTAGFGTDKYGCNLNYKSSSMRTVRVDTLAALYPLLKARCMRAEEYREFCGPITIAMVL